MNLERIYDTGKTMKSSVVSVKQSMHAPRVCLSRTLQAS